MTIGPVGTFCYRLLVEPELGTGLGNTVFVGLEIVDHADRARLLFSGLDKRVEVVREELSFARMFDGHSFSTNGPTSARELSSAMGSMKAFVPELVRGHEILQQISALTR
ncbi:MAG: hypothetical protein AB7T06_41165 [Kofleriaceae bacterium]